MGEFNHDLLRVIACPVCGGTLRVVKDNQLLECERCEIKYPIKDGIPSLMPPKRK
jgi:uncharacterized protein YbaR (Trm112 family)